MALTVNDLREQYYKKKKEEEQAAPASSSKTVDDLRQAYYQRKETQQTLQPTPAPAAPKTPGASAASMYGSANRASSNLMDMATRAKLMQTANEMADIKTRQAKTLENPRASTAYTRQTEKQPMQDRAKKVAEIRKDIDTLPEEQGRVGKVFSGVGMNIPTSLMYNVEGVKQGIENKEVFRGTEEAQEYADAVAEFNRIQRTAMEDDPAYIAALERVRAAEAGMKLANERTDVPVDPNSKAAQYYAANQKKLAEVSEGLGPVGSFVAEQAINLGNWGAAALTGPFAPATLASEVMAGKMYDVQQNGGGASEAAARGVVSAFIEYIAEKSGFERVADIVKKTGAAGLWDIVANGIAEGGEEGLTYALNYIADEVFGDPNAKFHVAEFLKSAGAGVLFGGIVGTGATVANRARLSGIGSQYQDVAPELVAEGLQMNQDTDAYRTATEMQRKLDAGKTLSNVDVGRVVQDNEAAAAPLKQAAMEMAEAEVKQRAAERTAAVSKSLGYGKEGARVFGEIYNGGEVDAKTLLAVFDTPYQAGLTGGDGKKYTDPMQIAAYSAGNSDRIAQQGMDAKAKPGTVFSKAESGFDYTNAPADLTQQQRNFGNLMAKAFGVKGSFDKDGGANYNAYYDSDTGAVAFAKDFGIDSALMDKLGSMDFQQKVERLSNQREQSFTFYVAHEIANHVAANRAPAEMRAFNNAMYRYLQDTEGGNQARERMAFYRKNKVELDTQGAIEEIGADSILMLYDGDEQKFMAAMDRVLNGKDEQAKKGARTWGEALKNAIAKLKAWAKKLTGRQNAEAKAEVEKGISELEKLREMFETAVAKAAQNTEQARKAGATKNTTQEGGVKHSVKLGGFADINIDVQAELNFFGIKGLNDYIGVQKVVYNKLQESGFLDPTTKRRIVENADTGIVVEIGKKGIFETFGPDMRYARLPAELKRLKIATIRHLPEIIRYGEVITDGEPNSHNANSTATYTYIEHPIKIGNETRYVVIDIRRSPEKDRFWVHHIHVETKKGQVLAASSDEAELALNEDLASGGIIAHDKIVVKDADYIAAVNAGDMEAAQRMVDEAAKAAGYTRKQFHETKDENIIHVFDLSLNTNASADYGTPFGVFTKSHSRSVGLGGKQMPLFVKADRTFRVKDRSEIANKLPAEYSRLVDTINRIDDEYGPRYESLGDDAIFGFDAWLDENDPDDKMRNAWDVLRTLEEQFGDVLPEEILSAEREHLRVGKEWEDKTNRAILDAKTWITKWLRDNRYDSMELEFDNGAGNRVTDALIALDPNQVKSAAPVTYDDAGNVIPLSERFNAKSKDIRYSIKSYAKAAGLEVSRDADGRVIFAIAGKPVTKVTPEHIRKNSGLGGLITVAQVNGNISAADATEQYKAVADIMNMIINTQDPEMVWAWVGSSLFSAVKSNADGQYGTTIDFTTVCRKTQDMITAMSRAMVKMKRGLTKDEVTQLQSKLIAEGSSVPCPVCYVFSRWAGIGSVLDNMYKWQQKYEGMSKAQINARIDELTDKLGKGKSKQLMEMLKAEDEEYDSVMQEREKLTAEKKQLNGKKRTAVKDNDAYTLSNINNRIAEIDKRMGQLNKRRNEIKASVAPELAWLLNVRSQPDYEQHGKVKPEVLFNLDDAATFSESYPLAWKYRTSRGPSAGKAILPYSDMRLGDMILGVDKTSADGNTLFSEVSGQFTEEQMEAVDKANKRVKAQNLIGGQRFQSTSDFRYDYALDYLMAFFEAQALGSKLQTYTKIVEFADMVAAVRGDVNLSVMPKNKGYITTNTGVNRLSFSSVTGVDFEAAKRASEMHDNAQLILVGINDQHILAALEDSEETLGKYIGFVIPYHASGASINEFIRVLVNNLGENYQAKSYQDYSDVQTDSVRKNATAAQLRRAELRNKLLRGKDGGKNWEPDADDLKFIRGKSVDISDRSFAELREVELKALRGDKAAIAEYESWTAGALWDLYTKLWTEGGTEYGVRLNTAQAKSVMPHEYWNKTVNRDKAYINGFLFRSYCYNLGLTPRFSGATVKGEKHGDFTGSKGYWKTLIDRPMYNNDGTYRDQQTVNVTDFQKEMLTPAYAAEKWAGYAVQEPNATRAARAADKFMSEKQFSLKGEQQMAKELKRIRTEGAKAGKSAEEIRAEVAQIVGPEYAELLKTYGAIERGETPFRDIQVPERTGKNRKVSQTVRTILEAEATPDAMIPDVEALVAEGALSFESYTDDQAIADATAKLQTRGWSNTLSKWISDVEKGVVTKENTVTGWALYNNAANKGDVETALTILQKMVGHQRNAAQALQATRVLKKLSPDAQLYGVQRSVQDLQDELNKKYGDDKAPQLKIDLELGEKFMRAETDAERDEVMGEIYRDIGKQMPSTFRDKWNAWRYLAMLGNARTHVRNIVGNAGFAPVVGIKNITATGIEALVSGVSGGKIGRTKAITADKAMLKAAWADYANVAEEISNGGKYSDFQNANKQIEAGRVIFENKALEKARTFNSAAMEKEDTWFSKPHYAAALASYCKANGITPQQIAKGGKAMDKARAYAIKEAQKATYRDTNALSQAFGEIGGKWRTSSNPVKKGVGIAIEGILPFRKTPANILARGVEYSPIGLMNGIKKAVWDVQKGNATAAEAIDNISAGLTGSMLMALGAFLAAQGLIRGGGEGDDKEKEFAELQGHQTYAMELPNGKSVTLDWLAPEALPFFIGVNFFESTQGKKEEMDIDSVIGSVTSITEPLLEMSCLQGLNDLIDSVGYASGRDVNALVAMAASAATSYLTQALPTLGGQIERTFERERMTTYSDKNKRWIPADLQYTIGKATAKIPGLDYQQIPYIDAWGRTESTGNFAENAFGNLLNPSYTSQIDTTAMEDELLRLYRSTGKSVFPSRAARYFMVNNERKDLTAKEYVQYATLKGRYSYELLTKLVDSSTYKSLTDAEKTKMVLEVFDNANKQAKAAISEYELDEWAAKYAEAEKKYGIKQEVFAEVRMNTQFLDSLKGKNGKTITNSLSLLKMEAVYNIPGLTDKQRQALFDYLDVGKSVRHYNKSLVKQKLAAMRRDAK